MNTKKWIQPNIWLKEENKKWKIEIAKESTREGLPWGWGLQASTAGVGVQSLFGELRFCRLKKKPRKCRRIPLSLGSVPSDGKNTSSFTDYKAGRGEKKKGRKEKRNIEHTLLKFQTSTDKPQDKYKLAKKIYLILFFRLLFILIAEPPGEVSENIF